MLLPAALTACATAEPPRTVNSACTALRALSYANAKPGQEQADDVGNRLDTAQTVVEVQEHNARWRAMCG
jgi:hypothetical protein